MTISDIMLFTIQTDLTKILDINALANSQDEVMMLMRDDESTTQ